MLVLDSESHCLECHLLMMGFAQANFLVESYHFKGHVLACTPSLNLIFMTTPPEEKTRNTGIVSNTVLNGASAKRTLQNVCDWPRWHQISLSNDMGHFHLQKTAGNKFPIMPVHMSREKIQLLCSSGIGRPYSSQI